MNWLFKLIEHSGKVYRYAYSCESKNLDGVILYSASTGKAVIEKESAYDEGYDFLKRRSLRSFQKVIESDFPEVLSVCVG